MQGTEYTVEGKSTCLGSQVPYNDDGCWGKSLGGGVRGSESTKPDICPGGYHGRLPQGNKIPAEPGKEGVKIWEERGVEAAGP